MPDVFRPLPLIAYNVRSGSLRWNEEVPRQLMPHFCSQDLSLNNGVVIMETCIDTRVFDLIQQRARAAECVSRVRN